ncbi:MAG: carbohydrate ABC transporter permease [Clostridium sp.]|jgi:multiple sugar transport system permease protein|nr:carbohydrate ABC transporter permease [Clostridium sp.]
MKKQQGAFRKRADGRGAGSQRGAAAGHSFRTPHSAVQKRRNAVRKRKRAWSKIKIAIATCVAAFFAFLFLTPIVLTVTNSFMSSSEISANYGSVFATTATGGKVYISEKVNLKFIPDLVSFSQYMTVLFKSPEYLLKFWNSVILVGPIVVFQLLVASLASYGFARYRSRAREMIFFLYIILMLMPYQVTLVPNYLVANRLGILDTDWAIWLPGIFSPFAVFLITKFIRRIPAEVIEAAQIDGAGEWQIYRRICMPLCKGVICSAAILVFIDYWNMVEQPLILLSDPETHPLSVFLSKINSGEIGLAFAVATVYMVPSLLVFLYGEDYLVEGITYQGGIKG